MILYARGSASHRESHASSSDLRASGMDRGKVSAGVGLNPEFRVWHELPLFRGSKVDLAMGVKLKSLMAVFAHFEPGRSDKEGQSYAYAKAESLALMGFPSGPSFLGLYGPFPEPGVESYTLYLDGYMTRPKRKRAQGGGEGTIPEEELHAIRVAELPDLNLSQYVRMVVAFVVASKVFTTEMVRRLGSPGGGPKRFGACVSVDGRARIANKWFLGSEHRKPNLGFWDRFSPGIVVGHLEVEKPFVARTRKDEEKVLAEVGDVAMVFTKYVEDVERSGGSPGTALVGHFVSLARTLHKMAEAHVVHGDLRRWNVVFGEDGVTTLIDYDLARKLGAEDCKYPPGFNTDIPDGGRHKDARPGGDMAVEHDAFALGAMMELYVPNTGEERLKEAWSGMINGLKDGSATAGNVVESLSRGEWSHVELSQCGTWRVTAPVSNGKVKVEEQTVAGGGGVRYSDRSAGTGSPEPEPETPSASAPQPARV